MKNKLFLLFALVFLLAFAGCGTDSDSNQSELKGDDSLSVKIETSVDNVGKTDNGKNPDDKTQVAELTNYIGPVVSDDYICYKTESTRSKGAVCFHDYNENWHESWYGWYYKETDEAPYLDSYYFNLYSESETKPDDGKKYAQGYLWDAEGKVINQLTKYGELEWAYTYDQNGNVLTATKYRDGNTSIVMEYTYNESGFCTSDTQISKDGSKQVHLYNLDEDGHTHETTLVCYDKDGNETKREVGVYRDWVYEYDEFGRITALNGVRDGHSSAFFTYEYDATGHLVAMYDAVALERSYYISKKEYTPKNK